MLTLAMSFEWRALARRPTALVAIAAFLAVGILAIIVGQRYVAQWEQALTTAAAAQAQMLEETRGYLAAGEAGPSDRPWVDLAKPLWQDWYSATRVARLPNGLAGVADGAVDSAPAVFRINRSANPLAASGYRIENPELAAGAVDLVLVLGLLLPLLIGVLGLNIGSRERESHLEKLITIQSGSASRWVVTRIVAVASIAGAAGAGLCVAAGLAGGAGATDTALLTLMTVIYAFLWSGLLLLVNASAPTVRSAAFSFGSVWMLLCVLLPALGSEYAVSRLSTDYAAGETLEARAQRYDLYEQDVDDLLPALYTRYPTLRQLPGATEDPLDSDIARHVYDGIGFSALAERHEARHRQQQEASRISQRWAWFTPQVAFALAVEQLAGVGPEAAAAYRRYLVDAVLERGHWLLETAWSKRSLGPDDFETLVAESPAPFRFTSTAIMVPLSAIGVWTLIVWLVALGRLRKHRSL